MATSLRRLAPRANSMLARLRQATSSTVPASASASAATPPSPASSRGEVLMPSRGSASATTSCSPLAPGSAIARRSLSAASRGASASAASPARSRPARIRVWTRRSASGPSTSSRTKSFATLSKTPSGSHSSGEITAEVPVKPRGATPITVKSRALTRSVRPTRVGSAPLRRHRASEITVTATSPPGRSSASLKPRPRATLTPSVSK
jgi:hypothetical protein